MKQFLFSTLFCLCLVSMSSCKKETSPAEDCEEKGQGYQTKFTTGSTNNRIEILDWGGNGQPVLFLTGLGNTAHVFVDFAPKFTDKFHVYAMSRRGYGASDQTPNGYGVDTLAKDLLAVTKFLKLEKAIIIGHSISSEEISKFASTYPDKVERIVYLDAAYDRTVLGEFNSSLPDLPEPVDADYASFQSVKSFLLRTSGVSMPDEELRHLMVFGNDGRYLRHVTPATIDALILAGVQRPDYKNIKCPALSIYSVPTVITQIFPFYPSLDADGKKKAEVSFGIYQKYAKEQRDLFAKEVQKGVVKGVDGANHYVFISHPVETEKFIRDFLK